MTGKRLVLMAAVLAIALLPGCAMVDATASVVGTAASTAVGVAGTVVETGADIATAPLRD